MRNLLLASTAAMCISGQADAQFNTTFFDGYEYVQNYGPTPDQVQSQAGFNDGDISYSDSQVYSAWLATSLDQFMVHQWTDGTPIEIAYATLIESNFPDETNINALWIVLHDSGSGANGFVDLEVFMCSDPACTNFLWAETTPGDGDNGGAFPIDGTAYNLQVYINPMVGTVTYKVPGGMSDEFPMNIVEFSGSFLEPIAGVYWQLGCDSYSDVSRIWATCYKGMMEQVFLYSGPYEVYDTPDVNQVFYNVQGNLVVANELGTGIGVYGSMPTIFMHHDPNQFLDNNAAFFGGIDPPPVQPFFVQNIYDLAGNTGWIGWDSMWPY